MTYLNLLLLKKVKGECFRPTRAKVASFNVDDQAVVRREAAGEVIWESGGSDGAELSMQEDWLRGREAFAWREVEKGELPAL
ncbi:hypothetical protein ACTID9_03280 [Brevibacillus fluminis]|uniref:hypothetical protein n=1 Tax=Brevibacillus fluminis TaxID=511487 RepID=UPI003F8B1AC5